MAITRASGTVRPGRLLVGPISAVGVVTAFGAFVLASRFGFATSALTAADLLAIRFTTAAAIAVPLLWWRRPKWPGIAVLVAMALSGGLGFSALAYLGFSRAPASHGSALIHGMLPLFTALLAFAAGRRVPRAVEAGGLAMVTAGALGLVLGESRGLYLAGDVLLLAASLSWAAYGLLVRRSGLAATDAAAFVVVLSAVVYLPAYCVLGSPESLPAAGAHQLALQAAVQGVLVGFASVWFYSMAASALGPQRTAAAASLVPAVVAVSAVPLLGEHLSAATALSVLLVVIGAVTAVPGPRRA